MDTNTRLTETVILIESDEATKEVCEKLNKVIAQTLNSSKVFLDCAGAAESVTLSQTLMDLKHQRDEVALTLQKIVSGLGHTPATEEAFVGWLHRVWTKGRLAVESGVDHAIAKEVKHEEETMRLVLEDALQHPEMPVFPAQILNRMHEQAIAVRDMMDNIEEPLEPKSYININRDEDPIVP